MLSVQSKMFWTSFGNRPEPDTSDDDPLGVCADQLASLRLSMRIAAQFADSPSQTSLRQQQLRERLIELRIQYAEKIDEFTRILKIQNTANAADQFVCQFAASCATNLPFAASTESCDPCI